MIRIKTSLDHKSIRRLIWLVLTVLVLFVYSLQSVAGTAYYSMIMENDVTVSSPPVILQNGTAGTSTIYTNNTSAKASVEAPLLDYVDNNETDIDSSIDKGTHSNFTAQQAGPDSTYDSLTEEDTGAGEGGAIEDYVDNNTSDVDSSTDLGSHSNFENQKATDSVYDTLAEENTGGTGTDVEDYVDATSDVDSSPDIGNHSNFENQKAKDATYDTIMEEPISAGDWGITDTLPSSANVPNYRYMGGTSPDIEGMNITKIHIYCSTAGTMAVGVWTGGSLSNPVGAVKRTEAYNVSVVAGWNEIDVPDYSWPANTVTWIGWTCDGTVNVYASSSSSDSGDFQSARGRYSQTNPATADPTQPMNSTIGAGTFADWWYVMYLEYVRPDNYQLDLEVQFTGLDFDEINEELCIYTGSTDAENITVDYWTGSGWSNLLTDLAPNTWNNVSVSLTSATFTIRFGDGTPNGDTNQDSWQIDACLVHVWGDPQNWELDLEVQFTDFIDFLSTEKLCIYAGTLGSEDLEVEYWNGTGWENLASDLTPDSWNNYTVSLTSPTFTIRFKDGTNVGDTPQDQWQIDASLLNVEGGGSKEDAVDQQSNVDGLADVGTHGNFTAQQYGPDSIYDTLTEENTGGGSLNTGTIVSAQATNTSSLIIPNVNVPSDVTNSILVVVTACEHDIEGVRPLPTAVRWGSGGGQDNLTKVEDHYVDDSGNTYSCTASMWILRRPNTDTTKDVVITWNATALRVSASAFVIENVADSNAEATAESAAQDQTPTNTAITTVSADAFIIDVFVSGSNNAIGPTQTGQTERIEYDGTSHCHGISDKQGPDTPGQTTLGWTSDGSNRQVHVIAAFAYLVPNYELDLEVQWTGLTYQLPNEELCIYGGTMGSEDIKVEAWNGTDWETVLTDLSSGWNNASITDWLTGSTFTIRFKGGTETGDTNQDTWQIDVALIHVWQEGGETYELDLEVQWTGADYSRTNEELCIKTGTFSGSENIQVRVWNSTGSSWHWLMNLTANQWNNVSITSYLTSSNFTVQYLGGTETSDTSEDSWNIDATLLHVWTGASNWLSGWDKRVKITIDHNDVDSALSNFPILVYLSNSSSGRNNDDVSFVFDEVGSNSKKIAVTESDATTQCYVEIEKWDDASEQAWLWVKVPSISNTSDTDLYLYYDNDHADNTDYVDDTNTGNSVNVWDSYFKMVQHMRDNTTSSIVDSTSNDNDGTKLGAGQPAVTTSGNMDGAQNFPSGDVPGGDYINCGNDLSLQITGYLTIGAWVKIAGSDEEYLGIAGKLDGVDQEGYALVRHSNNRFRFWVGDGTMASADSDANYTDSEWHYVVGVVNNGNNYIYVDGVKQQDEDTTTLVDSGYWAHIGRQYYDYDQRYWEGIIDEVRISNVSRSAAWIKASYESGRDDLLDFASEEDEGTSEGTYNYVDNNTTDVDSSADKGTHGNFTAQEYPDGIYDTLTEAGTSTPETSDNNVDSETITHGSTTGISGAQTTEGTTENMIESTIKKIGTDTSETGNALTLSFSHTLVSGTNRIVIVSIGIENGNTTDVDSVTYGGQTCTKAIDHLAQPPGNFRYLCEIWYILDADLPSDGSQTVNITCSGIIQELEVNAYCAEYIGVTQGTPEATHGSNSTSSPVTNTISPSDDAWVMSVAGSGNTGTDPTHNEGQVELIDFQDASSVFTVAELRGASGETSLSTSFSGTINRLCRACASWTEAANYQLDIEHVVNSIGEYENYNLTTRAYRTASENFYLQLYNFTSTQWVNMSTITASSLTWYNTTFAKADFVNGTNQARIRYWQGFDATQEILYVDYSGVCGWNLTTNYELDLEVQWTGADYTKTNEELCIKTGTFSGSENIQVRVWNTTGSSWHWLMNLTASQWSNVSITSYLTSSNFTVQFLGGTETGDTGEDSWNIDVSLLHVWTVGTYDYVLRVNNTVTDSWQVRLKKYSDSNISRLQDCTIYFHNSTYGTSSQIIIENGSYVNQTGPWYDLGDSETIYIAMTVQANDATTSNIYVYLEIRTPNTTTYAQYVITFEIT